MDSGRPVPGGFDVMLDDEGLRFTTGPAGIAWRPGDTVEAGDVRVQGTLTVLGAPVAYREAFGIFVGGHDLDEPGASYVYFLVRPAGEFAILRRAGSGVSTLVGWTAHAAVQRVAADWDEPVNALAVEVRGGEARFLLNGTVVFLMPAAELGPRGLAGVRVNHHLDVRLTGWSVGPPPPAGEGAGG